MAMAVDISQIAGVATDLLSSSASVSLASVGSHRADPEGAPGISTASKKEGKTAQEGTSGDKGYVMERAQNAEIANNTTFSFERSDTDGKVYMSVKDKRTGKEICRIPKNYLSGIDPQYKPRHQVDVRI
jgi:uncharacterized FlaG/YvyC family protein